MFFTQHCFARCFLALFCFTFFYCHLERNEMQRKISVTFSSSVLNTYVCVSEILRYAQDNKICKSKNTNTRRIHPHLRAKRCVSPQRGFLRPPCRSVNKNRVFPVKNEKLFERSEFFSFREIPDFLAPERQPAVFFRTSPQQLVFLFLFLLCGQKKKEKPLLNLRISKD